MLLARDIKGNIWTDGTDQDGVELDFLELEWFDTERRIIRGFTVAGREIGFKNLGTESLFDGDICLKQRTCVSLFEYCPVLALSYAPKTSWIWLGYVSRLAINISLFS